MHLEGSCHCKAVRFELDTDEPVPYQRCYCSICRKTQGGGGYAINLGGRFDTLKVRGREHVRVYQAMIPGRGEGAGERVKSQHERHFCGRCGSHLWAYNSRWPELVHPVASAIDTPLPLPTEQVHMMVGSKANWVGVEGAPGDPQYEEYPALSLARWHETHPWHEP